uniref:Leucine-rich repeat protein SHOC-2 n=1 Tax=Electrophorus electricus TaxID=8005 RepID=A0A4W4F338_ELEEL
MANELIVRALKANAKKINLSSRNIDTLPKSFSRLTWVLALQLNNNSLASLPPELQLCNLEIISLSDNQLKEIPAELGLLKKLTEINLNNNKLTEIPQQLYNLTQLRKLHLARNNLTDLPEVGCTLVSSTHRLFQILMMVTLELLESTQELEVLSLKEHAARLVLKENLNKFMLSRWSSCALCLQPFLTTWVELA